VGDVIPLKRSERNARWLEKYIRIPEGRLVGQPLRLTAEQRRWLEMIYDTPTRTFILSMGRKNAKTAFSACLLLLHLAGPEARPNSQLYSAAQSRDQAAVLFELAAKMVRMSPELSAVMNIRDTAKQLLCPELGTVYRALSADASTAFGLSPALNVHDELGQTRGPRSELYDALETASAAQDSPLSIVISTQAASDKDLLSTLIDDALEGGDPTVKCVLYTADINADPFEETTIRQANPHYDVFMNKDEVMRQAQRAKRMPSMEASYRNLILNQRIESFSPFVSKSVWDSNGTPAVIEPGEPVYCGLDLSSVADLTAFVMVSESGAVEPYFWLPQEGLADKAAMDKVPYDVWHREGFLYTTPGPAIEYAHIAEFLKGIFDRYNVAKVGFDRYNMRFLKPWLIKAGLDEAELEKFHDFGQGFVSMSPALRELETRLLSKRLAHGKNPILTMCAANAKVETDPAGNRKFTKRKSTGRIDGMVALAMAVGVMPLDLAEIGDLDGFLSGSKPKKAE